MLRQSNRSISTASRLGAAVALGVTLCLAPMFAAAAGEPAKPHEATVTIKSMPSSIQVDAQAPSSSAADGDDAAKSSKGGHSATIRIDGDHDWDSFNIMETAPWIVGLVFLVVGSIFLTPIILLIGIIWYKLRKARLQNEAMLKLAERGVVPPAQAAEALAAGTPPAQAAPQVYQQAIAIRKRAVWSDLRKGVILAMAGLALSLWDLISSGGPNSVGLVLLFVGAGYVVLWWLEGRHLEQAGAGRAANGGGPAAGGD